MSPRALGLVILALVGLAGCTSPHETPPGAAPALVGSLADSGGLTWAQGNWWAYHALIENVSLDVALIVHDVRTDSFRVGTNLSTGFFGLPWSGNVTPDLNPRIGPDDWQLFDFPLTDGKTWTYRMLGHDATTTARAAAIHVPGAGLLPGFRMESASYGHTFARYDYVPTVGWFTRLQLIEPTDGHTVLDAELTAFGRDWQAAYYVENVVRELQIDYPTTPESVYVTLPAGYLQVRANLLAASTAGILDAQVRDIEGRLLTHARVVAKGADLERASVRMEGATTWTLDHKGAGTGSIHLEITGLSATGPLAESPRAPLAAIDLASLVQSTRPVNPHAGQVASAALPVFG